MVTFFIFPLSKKSNFIGKIAKKPVTDLSDITIDFSLVKASSRISNSIDLPFGPMGEGDYKK